MSFMSKMVATHSVNNSTIINNNYPNPMVVAHIVTQHALEGTHSRLQYFLYKLTRVLHISGTSPGLHLVLHMLLVIIVRGKICGQGLDMLCTDGLYRF